MEGAWKTCCVISLCVPCIHYPMHCHATADNHYSLSYQNSAEYPSSVSAGKRVYLLVAPKLHSLVSFALHDP